MLQQIQALIGRGRVKEAIEILVQKDVDNALLLSSRYSRLCGEKNRGVINEKDASVESNCIVNSILESAKLHFGGTIVTSPRYTPQSSGEFSSTLTQIVRENFRRNPAIANESQAILDEYRGWQDARSKNATFDVANRRLNLIKEKAESLIKRLSKRQEDAKVNTVERIAKLLTDPVPSYLQLQEAYTLACGRGFKSSYIEQQLQSKPSDKEVRITITEKIEQFAATIQ